MARESTSWTECWTRFANRVHIAAASEPGRNNSKGFKDFFPESQGQNLAVTVLYVPHAARSVPPAIVPILDPGERNGHTPPDVLGQSRSF